ncbi:MAG TPA: hypothetical protein VKH35_08240 [Thermoanaerobaculia bacterium]|nr:hypothetical protein [Thermoanaerobaculia bacterium]
MRIRSRVVAAMAAAVLATAAPLAAFVVIELIPAQQRVHVMRGMTFRTQVRLAQAALCDGSVRLAPGMYNVEVFSLGDGSVRATFFDQTGRKAGEAKGIIAVLRQSANATALLPAVQKGPGPVGTKANPGLPDARNNPGPPDVAARTLNFQTLGFQPASRTSFSQMGQKLNLEIASQDGSHGILIGLLLPAVMPRH